MNSINMSKLIKAAEWTVVILGTVIAAILLTEKIFFSFDSVTWEYRNNVQKFIVMCFVYTFVFLCICRATERSLSPKRCMIVCISVTILFELLFCLSLIIGGKYYFSSDAGVLTNLALRFMEGDYSAVSPKDSYLTFHPHQYGMIFIFETIMRVLDVKNGMIFQLMNIVLVLLGTLSGFGIVWKIRPCITGIIGFSMLQITFFPLFFYVAVAYGDLPSICITLMAVYCLMNIFEGKRYVGLWMLLTTILLIVNCLFKKNSVICLIAIVLVCLVEQLRHFSVKKCIWLVVTVFAVLLTGPMIQKYYEGLAGRESGKGMPMVTYIAMSMQEGLGGPGSWSGYHTDLFMRNNYDYDVTHEMAMEDIKESMTYFAENPLYMLEFYLKKISYQWTEGTFDGIAWGLGNGFAADKTAWVDEICNGKARVVFAEIANGHQCVVYTLFLCGMLFTWKSLLDKKRIPLVKMLFIVMVIGGFLFELIWESSSRYVMIYYTMMLPLSVDALCELYKKNKSYEQ